MATSALLERDLGTGSGDVRGLLLEPTYYNLESNRPAVRRAARHCDQVHELSCVSYACLGAATLASRGRRAAFMTRVLELVCPTLAEFPVLE